MDQMLEPLDALIFRIHPEDRDRPWGAGRAVFAYDPDTRTAQPYRRRWLGRDGGEVYFLVTKGAHVTGAPIELRLADGSEQMRLVEVVLAIQGVDGERTTEAVAALAAGRSPAHALAVALDGFVQEFVREQRALRIDVVGQLATRETSAHARTELGLHLQRRARERLALVLQASVRLPEDDLRLENMVIDAPVYVRDSEEELRMRLELTIHPPDSMEARHLAIQRVTSPQRLRESIEHRALRWFRDACSLEDFCYQPTAVRAELERRIRAYVEGDLSRVLFHFRLGCTAPFPLSHRIREDYAVQCKVEPGQTVVPVHHKIMVRRVDIAKFRAARIDDFERWMADLLEQRTRTVLFSKSYAEVLLDFPAIEAAIKRDVERAANEIGFRVEQLITIPADQHMQSILSRSLAFDTDAQSFASKDSRVDFRLSLHVRVKLPELRALKSHLRPGNHLAAQLERRALEATREEIRKISPECLHTHFGEELVHDHATAGESREGMACRPSPEARIGHAIRESLATHFIEPTERENCAIEVESLTITPHPTELTDIYSAVRPPRSHDVEVVADALGRMGEQIVVQLGYRVVGIAYGRWSAFEETTRTCQSQTVTERGREIIAAIDHMIAAKVREKAEMLSATSIRASRPDLREQVKEHLCREACESIVQHFGLALEITYFRRTASGWENHSRRRLLERMNDAERRLGLLRNLRQTRFVELGPDDPEMEVLDQQIAAIEMQLDAEFAVNSDDSGLVQLSGTYGAKTALESARGDRVLPPPLPDDEG